MKDKVTKGEFRSWVEWTRERLPAEGDLPGIASYHWDKMRAKQAAPWSNFVWTYYHDFDSGYDPTIIDWLAQECLANPDELAYRFTALRYLYELSHHDYENLSVINADAEFAETRGRFLSDFNSLIRLVKVEDLEDWRTIRWEILNAYTIRECWDRALDLYDRMEHLKLIELPELHALRGQFRFLQAFATQGLDLSSLLWAPKLYSPDGLAIMLVIWAWCDRKDYPCQKDLDLEVVREVSYDLERALSKGRDLPLLYRTLLAGCQFALSEFQKAAANYESLKSTSDEWEAVIFKGALRSAALSYSRGGETGKAIAAYQRLLERFPNEKGLYLRIAELHTRTIPPDSTAAIQGQRPAQPCYTPVNRRRALLKGTVDQYPEVVSGDS